jgi:hypothetical protein
MATAGGGGVLGIHVRKWLFSSPSRSHPAAGIIQFVVSQSTALFLMQLPVVEKEMLRERERESLGKKNQ